MKAMEISIVKVSEKDMDLREARRILRCVRLWMAGVAGLAAIVLLGCDGERMDLLLAYKAAGLLLAWACYRMARVCLR